MAQQPFTDQLSRTIAVNFPPKRIISLVPSQTELLFDLGLNAEIIGITKFCTHPSKKVKSTIKIGGTKKLDIELIRRLKPDLIIGNKEENEQSQIETLIREFPVWMSDIADVLGALDMITKVGALVNKADTANQMAKQIETNFNTLQQTQPKLRVAYLIWQKPYMVAGKGTFIDDMLTSAGFTNVFEQKRYPEVNEVDLIQAKVDVVMLSSEPFPFRESHLVAFRKICPHSRVILADGEMFSWYGSRMLQATSYFKQLVASLKG